MYGVTRIDMAANRTHAWVVTIQRAGRIYRKHFSDGVYGGRRKARQAARAWRDRLAKTVRPMTRREYAQIKKRSNRTGYVGVTKYCQKGRSATGRIRESWYWAATWTPVPGQPAKQVKFSVRKYGQREAFRRALALRARMVRALTGEWLPIRTTSRRRRTNP